MKVLCEVSFVLFTLVVVVGVVDITLAAGEGPVNECEAIVRRHRCRVNAVTQMEPFRYGWVDVPDGPIWSKIQLEKRSV